VARCVRTGQQRLVGCYFHKEVAGTVATQLCENEHGFHAKIVAFLSPYEEVAYSGPRFLGTKRRSSACRLQQRLRVAAGLSQEALADRAELHRTYISSIERAERNVSLENVFRLAAALGVDPRELLRPKRAAAPHGWPCPTFFQTEPQSARCAAKRCRRFSNRKYPTVR
jgi:DNA-binding XRE family transcriptional regulator